MYLRNQMETDHLSPVGKPGDDQGNVGNPVKSPIATLDNTAPTVTITTPFSSSHDGSTSFEVRVIFSERVTGFWIGDISVTGGTKSSLLTYNHQLFRVTVTPAANSTSSITIAVGAGAATDDPAGNNSVAASDLVVNYQAPSISLAKRTSLPKSCPQGYGEVLADEELETSGFCAMTFLVRQEGERQSVVSEVSLAQDYCLDFGAALISESEWVAMARQHELSEGFEILGQQEWGRG